jgi:hypothetical protein
MSTKKEIREVYLSDIGKQSKVVRSKCGILPFYAGVDLEVFDLYGGAVGGLVMDTKDGKEE